MTLAAAKLKDGLSSYYSDIDEAQAKGMQYALDLLKDRIYLRIQASYFEVEQEQPAAKNIDQETAEILAIENELGRGKED
jgi:CRISPR/Cas system-associated endoribonuclease Cas2